MFCKNCGSQLPDNAIFCGNCGTKVEVQPAPQQPAYEAPQQPAYEAPQQPEPVKVAPTPANSSNDSQRSQLADKVLSTSIAGLALAFAFGIPGIIVSANAKRKVAEYERLYGTLSGKAKVGSILSRVGLPLSFGMAAFYLLYIIILVSAG